MPRFVQLDDERLAYLKEAASNGTTLNEMAQHIGCCTDTLKRILNRLGLRAYEGTKYQVAKNFQAPVWKRPCSDCGCTKPRPKWQFRCDPCLAKRQALAGGLDE